MRYQSRLVALAVTLGVIYLPANANSQAVIGIHNVVRVRSCPAADSVLGPIEGDSRGEVRATYAPDQGASWVLAGPMPGWSTSSDMSASVRVAGHGPMAEPSVLLVYFLLGREATAYYDGAAVTPLRLVLDDSLPVEPDSVIQGSYSGARAFAKVPLSLRLSHAQFLQVLQAHSLELQIAATRHRLSRSTRTNLRALYRVVVCDTIK
jgi:hypothetical protein